MNKVCEVSLLGGGLVFPFPLVDSFSLSFLIPPDLEAQITLSAMSKDLSLRADDVIG